MIQEIRLTKGSPLSQHLNNRPPRTMSDDYRQIDKILKDKGLLYEKDDEDIKG